MSAPISTPWLAGVFVQPDVRGRGYAGLLIVAVEQERRAASIPMLWLYTRAAPSVCMRAPDGMPVDTIQRDNSSRDAAIWGCGVIKS